MRLEKIRIGDKRVMPIGIPSGIVTTTPQGLELISNEIPEVGVLVTKSIGPEPRIVPEGDEAINRDSKYAYRESILVQTSDGTFRNAVGLANPGVKESVRHFSRMIGHFPSDKFLFANIFGKNPEEFAYVAKLIAPYVDGIKGNFSCPHVKGHGMVIGKDPKMVYDCVEAMRQVTDKPIAAKLTPNTDNNKEIAKSAVNAGADIIVAINTTDPDVYYFDGHAVLWNKIGGKSGREIKQRGLECIAEIREAVPQHILVGGVGGIRTARDALDYFDLGVDFIEIGSAMAGMTLQRKKVYFSTLVSDIENGTNNAEDLIPKIDMSYRRVRVEKVLNTGCDFKVYRTNSSIQALPGQFVFAWIPEIGEKPFSVMDDDPLTLGVLERGYFTRHFNSLKEGDEFYVRGAYGQGVDAPIGSSVVLVGGGCGIAGLYLLAKKLYRKANIVSLLAAKDKAHLPYLREFQRYGQVFVATEDGSSGKKGLVTDLFNINFINGSYFFNCGPRAMVSVVLPLELNISGPERVYYSVDEITRCGVGLCGSCANKRGSLTCIEGPFMNP